MLTRVVGAVPFFLLILAAAACVPQRLALQAQRYEIDVRLDPQSHTLAGSTAVELQRVEGEAPRGRRAAVELELHPALRIESVEVEGATMLSRKERPGRLDTATGIAPTTHRLIVEQPESTLRVRVVYRGELHQNVAEGESEGEIHNFAVAAHVGEDGLYLGENGHWYPRLRLPEGAAAQSVLADYALIADPIDGFELVAGFESEPAAQDGRQRWSSPYPVEAAVLLGGPLTRWSRKHGDVELHTVLAADKEDVAEDILAAAGEYLDRYEPLIGTYPFREFTVLEAFFSSGFAFPACTQIAGSQLSSRQQYRRHGYLDHELLHNWWGNGVYIHPDDGNWCEGLASYLGNYYGYVLDGDEAGARKQRRNHSNFLSAIEPEDDLPLGTFGLDTGAGRGVGYMKGAAVFQMLERRIGADALFAGLRRLTAERMGQMIGWDELQRAFEVESGEDLDAFFRQWVRESGAPLLRLVGAQRDPGSSTARITISQEPASFALDVPLRLHFGGRSEDVVVGIDEPVEEVSVPCDAGELTAVELDPDYHVFRKLKPAEVMPTSNLTRRGERLLILLPAGEVAEPYRQVADSFERAVLGDDERPEPGHEVLRRTADEITATDLAGRNVLILGDASRDPRVVEFLERTRAPVSWSEKGFVVEGDAYEQPGQALFFTVHHPDQATDGVTVYYGNEALALANARLLSFYANSLLVFETPSDYDATASEELPPTSVIRRIDFEFHDRIEF